MSVSCGLPTKVFEVAISVTPSLVRVLVTCSYVKDKEPILVGFYATPFGFGAIGFNIAAILNCLYNWFFENDLFLPVLAHSIYLVYSIHNFDWLIVDLTGHPSTQKARTRWTGYGLWITPRGACLQRPWRTPAMLPN